MKLYGLIGDSLKDSRSKEIFEKYAKKFNPDCEYRNFELTDIGQLTELLAEYPEIEGFNVTKPFKTDILPWIDSLTPDAEAIGAVNCVKVEHDNDGNFRLIGHNTDSKGFIMSIMYFLSKDHFTVYILGTGGAAKAVAHALTDYDCDIVFVSRTNKENAINYSEIDFESSDDNILVINATPVCPDFPYEHLAAGDIACDLNYHPSTTEFMRKAADGGAMVCNGLGMLHFQAFLSWDFWNLNT
ncbi:MAG: shikimate dehydrogenase [Muribaculaceae bacterium]|nr:shikimate dehydrogenase [Muribaculaceae bacterium]